MRILLAVVVALAAPIAVQADTVYFRQGGAARIGSVSGTIVSEDGGSVKVQTADGKTVSIPHKDVFNIVRGEGSSQSSYAEPGGSRSSRGVDSGIPGYFGVKG